MILSNGSVVQIPEFVSSACSMIQMELETEGLFRKTGSLHKQKVIQEQLQKGAPLQKGHHVIDVTNLLKTFFRSLPESLIPLGLLSICRRNYKANTSIYFRSHSGVATALFVSVFKL